MAKFTFSSDRVITLHQGQSVTLICGTPVVTRRIALKPGQFIITTCDANPKIIVVGCEFFRTGRRVRLSPGQRLIVTCS